MLNAYCEAEKCSWWAAMDVSSTRLPALLREVMTPQAVPSGQADPVMTALVKALVQPPAPSLLAQQTAPALLILPAAPMAVKSQQIASAGIVDAYLAQLETGEEAALATVVARKAKPEAETLRAFLPPSTTANDNASARVAGLSLLSLILPQAPIPRNAAALGTPAGRHRPANQSHGAVPNPEQLLVKIGFVSIMAGLLGAVILGFVLLLLR
ncbi:hypothetical protein LB519_14115 [Mesorhizobium sp. AD1-1]|uniref:hypothetical protein n=1 Tax=Mesorhizobium sp. AD1-1 TaxID=2876621 RepID=UPI001CCB0CF2|nr:hypothetical protein [Mesorhizobium sp. AD1-1]MBZ9718978.1 hypothetical protein [Mesorhizobium sp. AD1-1]